MTEVIFGRGTLPGLDGYLPPDSLVLLLSGGRSFTASGAETALRPLLDTKHILHVSGIPPNPSAASVKACVEAVADEMPAAIVAVGGGSVIDTAKLVALAIASGLPPEEMVGAKVPFSGSVPPIIAVPTTAGSGAERTSFAVMYIGESKYSVDHPSLEPTLALLDPDLLDGAPAQLIAVPGFDVIGHAIESIWNVNSDEASRRDAEAALELAWRNLLPASRGQREARARMLEAASLAGSAINRTRTTAAHAMSYHLTARYGVPHGHAVAVTLGGFLEYNAEAGESDTVDPRGPNHVREAITQICGLIGVEDASSGRAALGRLMDATDLERRPTRLGVDNDERRQEWARSVNVERLNNNPRRLAASDLLQLVVDLG